MSELPAAPDSERALLGAMLSSRDAVAAAADRINPEDFYFPAHATIYQAVLNTWAAGVDGDASVVAGTLEDSGDLQTVGGLPYLFELVQAAAPAGSITWHTTRVTDAAVLRRLHYAGAQITQWSDTMTPAEAGDAVARAQEALAAVPRDDRSSTRTVGDAMAGVMDDLEAVENGGTVGGEPVPTGLLDLDRLTNGGLRPGQLVIAGARPGMGKTTLALDLLRSVAIGEGKTALMFSLEMSTAEVAQRVLSAESRVPFVKMQRGELDATDWARMADTAGRLADVPLLINDDAATTMVTIQATARRLAQQHDLGLIVVDYLQLLTAGVKSESRQQEVSGFSRALKLLAKDLKVPVVAAAQLNRGVENRGNDAKPRLADLRESGAIEQDADIVMFIDRPDLKDPTSAQGGEAEIIVAKHRGGSTGNVSVASQLNICRFANLAG